MDLDGPLESSGITYNNNDDEDDDDDDDKNIANLLSRSTSIFNILLEFWNTETVYTGLVFTNLLHCRLCGGPEPAQKNTGEMWVRHSDSPLMNGSLRPTSQHHDMEENRLRTSWQTSQGVDALRIICSDC
jgi:hypothetical protein